jgi:hypothetical protein
MRIRKTPIKKTPKILKAFPLIIAKELSEAKTISATRRAITMLKLLGSHKYIVNSKRVLLHKLPLKTAVMSASLAIVFGIITITSSYGQWSRVSMPTSVQNTQTQGTVLTFDFSFLNPNIVINEVKNKMKNELTLLNEGFSLISPSWPKDNFTVAYPNEIPKIAPLAEQSWTTAHTEKTSPLTQLNKGVNGKVLSANTVKINTEATSKNLNLPDIITSTSELTSNSSNSSSQAPWISSLYSGSTALKVSINTNNDKIVHIVKDAFYSATGIFNNLYASEVHTDLLCVGKTCVTEEQFMQMVLQSQKNTAIKTSSSKQEDRNVIPTSDSNKWSRINRTVR